MEKTLILSLSLVFAFYIIKVNLSNSNILVMVRCRILFSVHFNSFGTIFSMVQTGNPKSMLFLGVSIIEDGGSGITMELEMNWDGNPSIILGIKTRFGVSLPVQVKQ
jgi:hypothetical protein